MKYYFILSITTFLMVSCNGNKTDSEAASPPKDSTSVVTDTIDAVDETGHEIIETEEGIGNEIYDHLVVNNPPYDYSKYEVKYYGADGEGDTIIYTQGKKILKEGTVEGEFVEIQSGDYLHLVIRDSKDLFHNFWLFIEDDEILMQRFWEGFEFKQGQKLRVHWKRERVSLPESGGPMVVYSTKKLELIE